MLRRFSISFAIFSMVLDLLIGAGSMLAMTALRPSLNALPFVMEMNETLWLPPLLYIVFPILWVVIFSVFAVYDGKKYLKVVDELAGVTMASAIAVVSQAGILYLTIREVSRALFVSFALLTFLLCILWRLVARIVFRLRKEQLVTSKHLLVVGDQKTSQAMIQKIKANGADSILSIDFMKLDPDLKHFNDIGLAAEVRKRVQEDQITDLVFAVPYELFNELARILPDLDDLPINIWAGMNFIDLSFADTRVEDFSGIPMLDLRAPALSEFDQLVKRGFDLVFGALLLLLASPVMLIISVLVAIFDGFPVLFSQERVGENGRFFRIYKFRTMVKNAEAIRGSVEIQDENGNNIHKTHGDPRVTSLGRFLRRTSLDELPQFFNVLKGEMSIVGPRPELPYLVEKYQRWQRKRLTVPPGITGWWQVTGRSDKTMHLHTEDDIYYVQNYSIWLDIQIIIRTIWVVLIGKGSY